MGMLDGGLSGVFGAALGPVFGDGLLHRRTESTTNRGKATGVFTGDLGQPPADAIKVQVEKTTQAMRRAPGYNTRDVQLIVLQRGRAGAAVAEPAQRDEVTAGGRRWALSMIEQDPARGAWTMRGTPAT